MRGEFVVTLDADLQDNPSENTRPGSLSLKQDSILVSGWKRRRFDPWHKVIPSRIFNWIIRLASGLKLHDHNCAAQRDIESTSSAKSEFTESCTVSSHCSLHARGFRVTEMEVQHRPRIHGQSNYGVERFVKGLLDLLTVAGLDDVRRTPAPFSGCYRSRRPFAVGFWDWPILPGFG